MLPCSWRAWTGVGTYGTLIEEWEECVWAATTLRQKASSEGSARKCARMTDAGATWCGRGQRRLLLWCQAYELRHAVSLQGPSRHSLYITPRCVFLLSCYSSGMMGPGLQACCHAVGEPGRAWAHTAHSSKSGKNVFGLQLRSVRKPRPRVVLASVLA